MPAMKILTAFVVLAAVLAAEDQEAMAPAAPSPEHVWLQQLVGDWTARSEATMEAGAEPWVMESTESVRAVGGLWIVGEGSASLDGTQFTSIMTLGYDPERDAFVGTWIDSMQTHLWTYVGHLDETRKVLTLDTEGPGMDDPTTTTRYRDVIEVVDADHRRLTSSAQAENGSWTTFNRSEYSRKR
jgi:hypothetical protein